MAEAENLVTLTAEIVAAMVEGNKVSITDVPGLIKSTYDALASLGAPAPQPEVEKPKGAVSARASIKPDGLISMIDGKKYQTLRRHITRHGYTPETYREAFGLPRDYPLTSANYSELRRGMAKSIGLGRKAEAPPEPAPAPVAAEVASPEPKRRGRPRKAAVESDAVQTGSGAPAQVEAPVEPPAAPAAEKPKRGRRAKLKPTYSTDEAPRELERVKDDDFFDAAADA